MLGEELERTLQNALNIALKYKHQFITLEHLLLALLTDKDAIEIFEACNIDIKSLKLDLESFVTNNLKDLYSAASNEPKPTLGFQGVRQRAVIHVQSSGKKEANGGNVLVAIFSERESHAVYFLQKRDLRRLDVVNYISHGDSENEVIDDLVVDNNEEEISGKGKDNSKISFLNFILNES